jgi:enoyl-CoA hydratase
MTGGFETIIYRKKDCVGYVTLNRPHVLNAYSVKMRDELFEALQAIKEDDEIRAVIINGSGEKAFCAGADLTEFLTAPSVIDARRIRSRRDIWRLLDEIPQPTICALHGYVLGSGLEIALFCDLRICSEDAIFGMPEASLGIIPGAGGTQLLPRTVGVARALEILLAGERIDAHRAFRIGLVNMVVKKEDLISTCENLAIKITSLDPEVVRRIKRLVKSATNVNLVTGMYLESLTVDLLKKVLSEKKEIQIR